MNELKICFCGGEPCEPFWYSESDGYIQGDYCYKIVCKKCSTTITGKTKEDAINNWNTNIDKQREKYLVHGHWIKIKHPRGNVYWNKKCSICGKIIELQSYNFCPNCGAKMNEEVQKS